MKKIPVRLSKQQVKDLDRECPRGSGSAQIGRRAVKLVRLHLVNQHPDWRIQDEKPQGADVAVLTEQKSPPLLIEVKGTNTVDIAWERLKVSGTPSYLLLTTGRARLYRVTDVCGRAPQIYELLHGDDFELEPEPRWRVKKSTRKNRPLARPVRRLPREP